LRLRSPAVARVLVGCLLLAVGWASSALAQRATITPEQIRSLRTLKSASGRFVAVGTNAVQMLDLLKWADGVALLLDQTLRVRAPSGPSPVRIVVVADGAGPTGSVVAARGPTGWVLTVVNYEEADVAAAARTLIRTLLDETVRAAPGVTNPVPPVPAWFLTGVIRNLEPAQRERDLHDALQAWSAGRLPTLTDTFPSDAGPLERSPAHCGVLVRWLLSVDPPEQGIGLVLARLASGRSLDIPTLLNVMRRETVVDLEAAWDDWLLNCRWRIGTPGRPTAWIAERIRAERLIYGVDSAMPNASNNGQPLSFADLIVHRKTRWASKAASAKAVSLRVHAAGRGREVGNVVDAYCRFLDAVRDRRSEAELKRLLDAADRALDGLESALKENPDEGQEHAGGRHTR
jgi:hypothetical protein